MKKIILAITACALLFLCAACGADDTAGTGPAPTATTAPASTTDPDSNPAGTSEDPGAGEQGTGQGQGQETDPTQGEETTSSREPLDFTNASAYDRYMDVMKTMSGSSDGSEQIDMDMVMVMSMDMEMEYMGETESESMEMEMSGNIKMITEGDKIQYAAVLDMGDLLGTGSSSVMEMYFDGENIYYAIDGVEYYMSEDDILDQIGSTADVPEFPESAIKSTDTKTVGGNEETTIIVDGNALTDYMMETAGEEFAELGDDMEITTGDVKIVIVNTPDGTPVSLEMEMEMVMSMSEPSLGIEMTIEITMSMSYVINAYGSGVEIDFSKIAA